jgi:hypothetical protein
MITNNKDSDKRFDEIFNHDPDRFYDNLKSFLHQELDRVRSEQYATDYEIMVLGKNSKTEPK